MNRKTKIALYITIGVLAVVGVAWANIYRLNSTLSGIEVTIDYATADPLVADADIEQLVLHKLPTLTSQRIKDINLTQVHDVLSTSPYIHASEVAITMGRTLAIHTCQRVPVAQVFDGKDSYYIDSTCSRIPLSTLSSPDIIIANFADTTRHKLDRLCTVATYLHSHTDLGPLFDQVYEETNRDIYLVPKLGCHVVLIGDTLDLDTKFQNLITVYRKGMQKTGWDTYSLINLKYKGQVICKRKSKN